MSRTLSKPTSKDQDQLLLKIKIKVLSIDQGKILSSKAQNRGILPLFIKNQAQETFIKTPTTPTQKSRPTTPHTPASHTHTLKNSLTKRLQSY